MSDFGLPFAEVLFVILLLIIAFAYIVSYEDKTAYHSETKAYREDGRMCDYYLEYQGEKLVNRTRLGCV